MSRCPDSSIFLSLVVCLSGTGGELTAICGVLVSHSGSIGLTMVWLGFIKKYLTSIRGGSSGAGDPNPFSSGLLLHVAILQIYQVGCPFKVWAQFGK